MKLMRINCLLLIASYLTLYQVDAYPRPGESASIRMQNAAHTMKMTDFSSNQDSLSVNQMMNCLNAEMKDTIITCEEQAMTWLKNNSPKTAALKEIVDNEQVELIPTSVPTQQKHDAAQDFAMPLKEMDKNITATVMQSDCVLEKTGAMDSPTGKLDLTKMKSLFLDESSLSTAQKSSATTTWNACVSKMTTSTAGGPIIVEKVGKKSGDPVVAGANVVTSIHPIVCITRALLLNECAGPSISNTTVTLFVEVLDSLPDIAKALT